VKKRIVVVFALVLILLGGCAPGKYIPKASEECYGTWINEKGYPQKVVLFAGGFKQYVNIADTVATYSEGTNEMENKWQDAEGNIWYRFLVTDLPGGEKFQALGRVSNSGKVYERVYAQVAEFNPKNYPTRIDPKSYTYSIWFRSAD
jgi:hypothetical protein